MCERSDVSKSEQKLEKTHIDYTTKVVPEIPFVHTILLVLAETVFSPDWCALHKIP